MNSKDNKADEQKMESSRGSSNEDEAVAKVENPEEEIDSVLNPSTGSADFPCLDCSVVSKTSKEFLKHIATHKGYRRFKCSECEKRFAKMSHLRDHEFIHTGERPFKCQSCGASFAHQYNLTRHHRTHTGERPFKCQSCGASFAHQNNLTIHHRTHTGERPYKCQSCGASFAHQNNLTRHHRTHTGERPFKCQDCDKSFSDGSTYAKHRRAHTGDKRYECKYCGKKFTQSNTLKQHIFTHTGEKPHVCDFCDRGFTQRHPLARHRSQHSGSKPYLCRSCKMTFSTRGELVSHKSAIHGNGDESGHLNQPSDSASSDDSEEELSRLTMLDGIRYRLVLFPPELMVVWTSHLDEDLLVSASINPDQTIICVKNLQRSQLADHEKKFLDNGNMVTFVMQDSDTGCSIWTVISFADHKLPTGLENQMFKNFSDVEKVFIDYAETKGMSVKNIMKYSDDLFVHLPGQLAIKTMAFDYPERNE